MKKMVLVLLMAVVASGSVWAQKGMMGVGVNAAMNVHKKPCVGGSAKFQYNISDYVRLEPSFSYYASLESTDYYSVDFYRGYEMAGLLNAHVFFMAPTAFRVYLFAGTGYLSYKESIGKSNEITYSNAHIGLNAGLGIDYRLSHSISLQVEAGAITGFGNDHQGGLKPFEDLIAIKANIGICYNF